MPQRPTLIAALATASLLTVAPAALAAPTADELASACTFTPIAAPYAASEGNDLRDFAFCVVKRLRAASDLATPTDPDPRLRAGAVAGLDQATKLTARSAANVRRVDATLKRRAKGTCRAGQTLTVRQITADSSEGGDAMTPRAIATFVLAGARRTGKAPLLGKRTKVAVVTRAGRPYAGARSGAIALMVASATCR